MITNIKKHNCTIDEFNEALTFCKQNRIFHYEKYKHSKNFSNFNCYLNVGPMYCELWYMALDRKYKYLCTRFDGEVNPDTYTGMDAWRILNRYTKVPVMSNEFIEVAPSAKPLLWYNPKYEYKDLNAYCYDVNSSYSWAMMQPMPDTTKIKYRCIVGKNEMGFDLDGNIVTEGKPANIVCPLIESPFKLFVLNWFYKKLIAKDKAAKVNAKAILNFSVGYLQRKNPLLRSAILYYANKHITDFVDQNTICCNTDSIVSLVPRPDLKIGNDLGEFKLEHKGHFAYIGYTQQWYDEGEIKYRGVPKSWFTYDWDLLVDDIPTSNNKYFYNECTKQIEEVQNEDN